MLILSTLACSSMDASGPNGNPIVPASGDLLIEEFYYSGAPPTGGAERYYSDQFIELVNAAEVPLDLSGVQIGDAFGVAGPINPGTQPDSFAAARPNEVVLSSVWRIPEGTQLAPGDTLVLAHDGTNHRPFSTIDLSGADFEAYVAESGGDDDHPTVANLESVLYNGGFDWLVPVFGASIVVLDANAELGEQQGPFGPLGTASDVAVLDAVDALLDEDSADFKRLPMGVDAGHAWVSGTYTGESLQRRRSGAGWQDTDDSGADFVVGSPQPGREIGEGEVFGDGRIELGAGRDRFRELTDAGTVELVAGPQGGWHLDVAVRFGGFGPEGVRMIYDALDTEGESVSFVTDTILSAAGLLEDGEDGWTRVGDRIVLDIDSADDVVDEELIVRVTAQLAGQTWSDERRVIIVDQE